MGDCKSDSLSIQNGAHDLQLLVSLKMSLDFLTLGLVLQCGFD